MTFLVLDLFCGAGGAAVGLKRAWPDAEIVGVDNKPQLRYPFEFVLADAIRPPFDLREFDFIWASPPCQAYSIMRNLPWLREKEYPELIVPVREMLRASGVAFAIENVMGAQRKANMQAGWLCGQMFGLPFLRHRLFETSFLWLAPPHPRHWGTVRNGRTLGSRARDIVTMPSMTDGLERYFRANWARKIGVNLGHAAGFELAKQAMGIDWMRRYELTQAVPPVYSEFIARQLRQP